MKATFEVDLSDSVQVNALVAFLQGTGATAAPAKTSTKKTTTTPAAPAATSTVAKTEITLDDLNELTSAKVKAGFRDKVKGKLDELGAPKVSALKPEQYEAYKTFLESLK